MSFNVLSVIRMIFSNYIFAISRGAINQTLHRALSAKNVGRYWKLLEISWKHLYLYSKKYSNLESMLKPLTYQRLYFQKSPQSPIPTWYRFDCRVKFHSVGSFDWTWVWEKKGKLVNTHTFGEIHGLQQLFRKQKLLSKCTGFSLQDFKSNLRICCHAKS